MPHRYFALTMLLLAGPLAGSAQSPVPTTGRLYVGLGTYVSGFQHVSGNSLGGLTVPVQLTVGYQLRPRLALQVGMAYNRPTFDYSTLNWVDATPGGLLIGQYYEGQAVWRHTTVSVVARYSLRQPTRRLQAEVLAGYAQERERYTSSYQYTAIDNTHAVYDSQYHLDNHDYTLAVFTAGLSARYRWGQHLEAVADGLLIGVPGHWSSPPGLAGSVGLRYHFGRRR